MTRDHRTVLVSLENRPAVPVPLKTAIGIRNRARRRGDLATVEAIAGALQASGICRECGRTLTNPESVAAGIGPECGPRVRRRNSQTQPRNSQTQPPKET